MRFEIDELRKIATTREGDLAAWVESVPDLNTYKGRQGYLPAMEFAEALTSYALGFDASCIIHTGMACELAVTNAVHSKLKMAEIQKLAQSEKKRPTAKWMIDAAQKYLGILDQVSAKAAHWVRIARNCYVHRHPYFLAYKLVLSENTTSRDRIIADPAALAGIASNMAIPIEEARSLILKSQEEIRECAEFLNAMVLGDDAETASEMVLFIKEGIIEFGRFLMDRNGRESLLGATFRAKDAVLDPHVWDPKRYQALRALDLAGNLLSELSIIMRQPV